jgi:hypothetical protein
MVDFVIDIDGTLADASHRLHWIQDPAYWDTSKTPPRPNWSEFLDEARVGLDADNTVVWKVMAAFWKSVWPNGRGIFITGRNENQRKMTRTWLQYTSRPFGLHEQVSWAPLYMRADGDRRPSDVVKGELLDQARADGYDPILAFEDRKTDAAMWRAKGLTCFHVAEGDY